MGSSAQDRGGPFSDKLMSRYEGGLVPQGISAEIIAERWGLTRGELDEFGARYVTMLGGKATTTSGSFKDEIHPVKVETEQGTELFDTDEGIRTPNLEKMATLCPPSSRRAVW